MTLPSQSAGHTPGPWYVDGEGIKTMVRGADATIVALRHRLPGAVNEGNMSLIARAPDLLAENSKLKGQLEEAVGALEPFAREEFCVELGGNVEGDMSPVFARNHAMLRIGDFRAARDLLSKLKEAGS